MSDPTDRLAALLTDCPEIGPLFEYGGANRLAAEWLVSRGVRLEAAPPEGPWEAKQMGGKYAPNWYLWHPTRTWPQDFTEAEALAVRDALNRVAKP